MAEIKDCIGKNVKISKGSITIKSEDGKTSVEEIEHRRKEKFQKEMELTEAEEIQIRALLAM